MCKHSLPFSCLYCPPVVTTILVSSPMNELYFLTSYRWKCIMYLFASGFFHSAKCTKHLFVLLHISVFCFPPPNIYIYSLLKYSWLTMFQVHSKVIQLYIYIYIIFEIIFCCRLLQHIDYSSLCNIVNLCFLVQIFFF